MRLLCGYLTDPAYEWAAECESRFGTHPVQVCHEWNTAVHAQAGESGPSKRAFTVGELEAFFDYADGQVDVGPDLAGAPARFPPGTGVAGAGGRVRRGQGR